MCWPTLPALPLWADFQGASTTSPECLQGGAAVAALAPLAPYFGSNVTVQGSSLCAAGLNLSYAPLRVGFRVA